MPETDLKLICQAIPSSDSGDISTQANSILKGLTGEDVEFDIQTGGDQPQLYNGVGTESINKVTYSKGTSNGNFAIAAQIVLLLDGVEVARSSNNSVEYTVTPDKAGKQLTCKLVRTNFMDSSPYSVTLKYTDLDSNYLTVTFHLHFDTYSTGKAYLGAAVATSSTNCVRKIGTYTTPENDTTIHQFAIAVIDYDQQSAVLPTDGKVIIGFLNNGSSLYSSGNVVFQLYRRLVPSAASYNFIRNATVVPIMAACSNVTFTNFDVANPVAPATQTVIWKVGASTTSSFQISYNSTNHRYYKQGAESSIPAGSVGFFVGNLELDL